MSLVHVPPEYAVRTVGCAECGGESDSDSYDADSYEVPSQSGVEWEGLQIGAGLRPVPARLLKGYQHFSNKKDRHEVATLNKVYATCAKFMFRHNFNPRQRGLWNKAYDRDTELEILGMIMFVDVCIQQVLDQKRLSFTTKAAFDKDKSKNQVRDNNGHIQLGKHTFYFGLAKHLQSVAKYWCEYFSNHTLNPKPPKIPLDITRQTVFEIVEHNKSLKPEFDLERFYHALTRQIHRNNEAYLTYQMHVRDLENLDVSIEHHWATGLNTEEARRIMHDTFSDVAMDLSFGKDGVSNVPLGSFPNTIFAHGGRLSVLALMSHKIKDLGDLLDPKKATKAGAALWNVFKFYAEKRRSRSKSRRRLWSSFRGKQTPSHTDADFDNLEKTVKLYAEDLWKSEKEEKSLEERARILANDLYRVT
jgi:hypothetical protein